MNSESLFYKFIFLKANPAYSEDQPDH